MCTRPMEPEIADAFGMTLLACQAAGGEPGHAVEVIERDDGMISTGEPARYFDPPEGDGASWVLERTRGRVLDVGAGAGRYSLAVQARGQEVIALDVSEGALDVCRERGVERTFLGTVADFAASDPSPIDTVLLMGNNLGLLGAPEDAVGFLDAVRRFVAPEGRIIAEGNDAGATDNPEHLRYHQLNRDRGRHPHLARMRVRHARYASEWFDYLMPSPDELVEVLEPTGWSVDELELFPDSLMGRYVVTLASN